ncbi:MAG TPA: nucleotidyl transferase AbiEii/AbiGii toxin family protein [Gemmatimonadaceae bacterium]
MRKEIRPLLRNLPPKTARALTQAITNCGKELGIGAEWVQRWVAFTVVADGLASWAIDGTPLFEFKGGAAIELRLRQLQRGGQSDDRAVRPRATKDLDATYHGALENLEAAVRAALATPRYNFTFRVESETPDAPHMRRFRIRVAYQEERFGQVVEQPFSNVKLEVSVYEGAPLAPEMVAAFSLQPFGIDGPKELPCIPLIKQIAQKLHAVTEPPAEGCTSDRFRDLLDLVMLSTMVPPSPELRVVCEETFHIRARHGWPPEIVTYPHWIEPMEQRAKEMGLDQRSADDIVAHVVRYVRDIANAR